MDSQKLRVFLADDHAVLRKGLELLLNSHHDLEIVGEAGNGQEALQKITKLQPDIVIMDLSMPVMDGFQTTAALKQTLPHIKVLVLTVFEDNDSLRLALKAGASGCILKSSAADELAFAIRRVHDGGVYLDATLTEKLVGSATRKLKMGENDNEDLLSERELEVLRLLAWGHSNAEISEMLHLSVRTVETYKTRSMAKLNLRTRADTVRYAVRRGWLKDA